LAASGIFLFAVSTAAHSQTPPELNSASFFRQAAIDDVEAAATLLERNHPGAAAEMGDEHFRKMLESARVLARDRTGRVSDVEGYLAVMTGFSNTLDDKHLSFKPNIVIARPNWVGLILGLRNGRWTVVDEDTWPGRPPLLGAVLESCDGVSADKVAHERLGGFRADWSIPAQQGLAAPWLLIDERNPFLTPLKQCVFSTGSGKREVPMDWQPISRDVVIARMNHAAGIGAAGFGIRRFGAGWWISIGEFTANGPAVVDKARKLGARLRASPFIVFDVRGNAGGASDIGDQIAQTLYGDDAIPDVGCPAPWRVSPDNLARLESYSRLLGDRLSPKALAAIDADVAAMRSATAAGRAFSRPLDKCVAPALKRRLSPRVYLLTDRVCFSSCLIVVRKFRELGAVQIGEATNANTNYQENRRENLPSGLGTIGVQATVDLSQPTRVGPFLPDIAYDGDLTDTTGVEAWVRTSVIGNPHMPRHARRGAQVQ
jgi:hypothetical protein